MTSPTPPDVAKEQADKDYNDLRTAYMKMGEEYGKVLADLVTAREQLAAVNATQATCKQSLQVGWTPASTPPTGTGWYVVRRWFGASMGAPAQGIFVVVHYAGKWEFGDITHYLPTPLPPLPGEGSGQ